MDYKNSYKNGLNAMPHPRNKQMHYLDISLTYKPASLWIDHHRAGAWRQQNKEKIQPQQQKWDSKTCHKIEEELKAEGCKT